MSAVPMIDRASDLIEALKQDQENFELSNLIFKNHRAIRSVYEYFGLKAELLEFAKDPETGIEALGPEPKKPDLVSPNLTDDEKRNLLAEYQTMVKIYDDRKKAMEMHVPYGDYLLIQSYLNKFEKTFHATPAVKGLRFKAFTKDVEKEEQGFFANMFRRNSQQS